MKRGTAPTQAPSPEAEEAKPRLPHEHDESNDSQEAGARHIDDVGRQAHADLRAGRVDTDRGAAADNTYRKLKRSAS